VAFSSIGRNEPLGDALDLEQQKLLNMLAFRIPY